MNEYPRPVRAGDFCAEMVSPARIHGLRINNLEVLRGLYVAVRDDTWGTVPGTVVVTDELFDNDSFSVGFQSKHAQGDLEFEWHGRLAGYADGSIRYELDGVALTDFRANRIGFVVLHSLNWAGYGCTLVHTDGSESAARFPKAVSGNQPFRDLSGIKLPLDRGTEVEIRFEGDAFETEDQRNWSDASFKTYSRPLALPFPVEYRKGDVIHQTVFVQTTRPNRRRQAHLTPTYGAARQPDMKPTIRFHRDEEFAWPAVGVNLSPESEVETARRDISVLHPSHVRVDVVVAPGRTLGLEDLKRASTLGHPLELAVHVSGGSESEIAELAAVVQDLAPEVAAVLVFDTDLPSTSADSLQRVRKSLALVTREAQFLGGTDDYFAELNRNRIVPSAMGADGVVFCLTPQVHDIDPRAVMETMEAIPAMIDTTRSFSAGAPVTVSPISLKPRRSIHEVGVTVDRLGRGAGSSDDRQSLPFAAAWFIASLANLAQAGSARLTFVELNGARGLVPSGPHRDSDRYPIFHAFEALHGAGKGINRSLSEQGSVDGVGFTTGHGARAIIANLTSTNCTATVVGLGQDFDVTLSPYDVQVVDVSRDQLDFAGVS